jgi:hypothetical protein
MIIYCSKKLEAFLGEIPHAIQPAESSIFGDWNGHLFTVERKKCLIFMNNRTCYSVVMAGVLKKNLKDFRLIFKNRLIEQLHHDLKLNERQEVEFRNSLSNISLSKSNNDRKILGTINHHVENLKYDNFQGGIERWDEVRVTRILNDYLVGTKLKADRTRNRDFFRPVELMRALIQ